MTDNISYREWPHAPAHLFLPRATYIVTAATLRHQPLFDGAVKRDYLLNTLHGEAQRFEWSLQAWAVLSNHYHFVASAPKDADSLMKLIKAIHSRTAVWLNRFDHAPQRKVWFQYWDTCLTYERSYLSRLNYVNHNPVKHGLVADASEYPWCSMAWFLRKADPTFRERVLSLKIDRISVPDQF